MSPSPVQPPPPPLVLHQEDEFQERENARLRREVFEVNDREARRLQEAMETRGEVAEAVLRVVTTAAISAAKFHAAAATLKETPPEGGEDTVDGDGGGRGGGGGGGGGGRGSKPAPRKAVVPLMGSKLWDEGDPALPAIRARFAPHRVRYFLDMEFGGFTALMKVGVESNGEGVQRLLDAGANPDVETSKGCTALSWAALMGHRDIIFILLKAGAKLDYPSITEGLTPLMQAVLHNRVECVLLLLQVQFERLVPVYSRRG